MDTITFHLSVHGKPPHILTLSTGVGLPTWWKVHDEARSIFDSEVKLYFADNNLIELLLDCQEDLENFYQYSYDPGEIVQLSVVTVTETPMPLRSYWDAYDQYSSSRPQPSLFLKEGSDEVRFWKALWGASPATTFQRLPVFRDGTFPNAADVPHCCWSFQPSRDARSPFISGFSRDLPFLIREEYLESLRKLLTYNEWDCSQLPTDLSSADVFPNPFLSPANNNKTKMLDGGFVLTGDPGIGKSTWLFFLLVLRLQARLPTIYQYDPNRILFFDEKGVRDMTSVTSIQCVFHELPREHRLWALVDSNALLHFASQQYSKNRIFIVQTPDTHYFRTKWMYKAGIPIQDHVLEPWSLSELICARQWQTCVAPEYLLAEFFYRYGPLARLAYTYGVSQTSLQRYYLKLMAIMAKLTPDQTVEIFKRLHKAREDNFSHMIFINRRSLPTDPFTHNQMTTRFATPFVRDRLLGALESKNSRAIDLLYAGIYDNPSASRIAYYLCGERAYRKLSRGGSWDLFKITNPMLKPESGSVLIDHDYYSANRDVPTHRLGLTGQGITIEPITSVPDQQMVLSTDAPCESAYGVAVYTLDQDTSRLSTGYYRCSPDDQTSFNAFLYDQGTNHVVLLQFTHQDKCEFSMAGIERLRTLGAWTFDYVVVTNPSPQPWMTLEKKPVISVTFPFDPNGVVGNRYRLILGNSSQG